jgi:hypothetical protein
MKRLHRGLQKGHVYENVEKGLDDNIFVPKIPKFEQKVNSWWDHFNQLSFINYRLVWIRCYSTSNRVGSLVWFKHGYFTITYFTCFTTFGCFMLQNCIQEKERWGHGKK